MGGGFLFARIFLAIPGSLFKGIDMKRLFYIFSALALVLGYAACEKQKWEESRVLHLKHDGDKGHTEGGKSHDGADEKKDH